MDLLFNIARVLSALLAFGLVVVSNKRLDISLFCLFLWNAWLFFTTLANDASISMYCAKFLFGFVVYLIIDYYSDRSQMVLRAMAVLAEILVYGNLAAMIIFPDGLYTASYYGFQHNWILGYKNQMLPYFLCFTVVAYFALHCTGKHCRFRLLMLAMLASSLLSHSATTAILMVFLIVAIALVSVGFVRSLNPFLLAALVLVLFFVIVVFSKAGYLSAIISLVSQRDPTFTGRTIIWPNAIDAIAVHPLAGWGTLSNEDHIAFLGHPHADNAHDFYLEMLLAGGLIGAIFLVLFFVIMLSRLRRHSRRAEVIVLVLALFTLWIAWLFEAYVNPVIFILFALANNIENYLTKDDDLKRRRGADSLSCDSKHERLLPLISVFCEHDQRTIAARTHDDNVRMQLQGRDS